MLMVLKSHDGNEITGLWISITIAFKFSTIWLLLPAPGQNTLTAPSWVQH
jgi:hypothetical protein